MSTARDIFNRLSIGKSARIRTLAPKEELALRAALRSMKKSFNEKLGKMMGMELDGEIIFKKDADDPTITVISVGSRCKTTYELLDEDGVDDC